MCPAPQSSPLSHLLQTKLHIPGANAPLVGRPHLRKLLDQGLAVKLCVITAPAGFGKSTLIAEWIRKHEMASFGWVSLDERDNDIGRFIEYFVAALRTVQPGLCDAVLHYVHETRDFSVETAMTMFINEIEAQPQKIAIVLDDYHAIHEQSIHYALTFLLEYMPSHFHLIVSSRSEPPFPLPFLFSKRQLVRITASELRFTADEIRELFALSTDESLTEEKLRGLESKTEGWIAGLQMILLSSGKSDFPAESSEFTAETPVRQETNRLERDIADYLAEEVLARQPLEMQRFLLKTAVLGRMNGELCSYIVREEVGKDFLERAVQAGLFVIPLDADRSWYRYHHMFGRLLHERLLRLYPEIVPELHKRACEWLRSNGHLVEAVEHALAAADFATASDIIVHSAPEMLRNEMHMLLRWFRQFPEDEIVGKPGLAVVFAWTLATYERLEEAESLLCQAEPYIDSEEAKRHPLSDEDIRGYFSGMRCLICLNRNETDKALAHSRDLMQRFGGVGHVSASYIINYNHNGESLLRGRFGFHGGLKQAFAVYPPLISGWQASRDHFYGYLRAIVGECQYERNELEQADNGLSIGAAIGLQCANAGIFVPALLGKARIALARREWDAASAIVQEARQEALHINALPFLPVINAFEARLHIRMEQPHFAAAWAETCRLQIDGAIDPSREFEQITLLRLLSAADDTERAHRYAERLAQAYDLKNRKAAVAEIRIVQALLLERHRKMSAAVKKIDQALKLGSTEGYLRLYADEGPKLYRLFTLWRKQKTSLSAETREPDFQAYIDLLESAFRSQSDAPLPYPLSSLTAQEMKILKLLARELANKEIAAALSTSTETVKRHCKNMYRKLSVSGRNEAVSLLHEHLIM